MIHITSCEYSVAGGQVAIAANYEVETSGGKRVPFKQANNLFGGPYTYEALQDTIELYEWCMSRNGIDAYLEQELKALRGAMVYLRKYLRVDELTT